MIERKLSKRPSQPNGKVDVLYLIERHEKKGEKVVGVEAELARSPRAIGSPPSP
jgi:hypothetical protein